MGSGSCHHKLEFILHIPWEGLEYNAGVNSVITAIFEQSVSQMKEPCLGIQKQDQCKHGHAINKAVQLLKPSQGE